MQKEIHMELTVLFISVLFLFFSYMKELGQHFPELPNLLYTYEKGKMFLLWTLFGGKQYDIYGNFSHMHF